MPEVREMRAGMSGDIEQMVEDPEYICKVAEVSGVAVGFLAYKNRRKKIRVSEVVVRPEFGGLGIEKTMLDSLLSHDDSDEKTIEALVPEENLKVQMRFKTAGFRAVGILRGSSGTLYKFERRVES